jgi:response regulator RpfG family c-di-GMP phosphodiesterase
MLSKRLYDTARVLVYDPVASNRNATRASLLSLGYRNVEGVTALDLLANRLVSDPPDLLLAEVAGAESETCGMIQAIRQGQMGDNPFIVVIATTWRRDGSIIGQVLNSGADDLVARPVSTTTLGERIRLLTERRKGFVVTTDYIGPDRRRNARADEASAECVEAPNPLKFRMLESLTDDEMARQMSESVQQGKEKLNLEKVRRDAVQLCVQWRMLEKRAPGARDFSEILSRMGRLAAEMKRRTKIAHHETGQEWCDSIAGSVQVLTELAARDGQPATSSDYQPPLNLLSHAASALGRIFAHDEVEPERLVELDRIVAVRSARSAAA